MPAEVSGPIIGPLAFFRPGMDAAFRTGIRIHPRGRCRCIFPYDLFRHLHIPAHIPMVCRTIFLRTRPLLIASVCANLTADAQITEGFETGYSAGVTQFAGPEGALFTLTSDPRITNFATFGANGSNLFLDTGLLEGNDKTPPSQIILEDDDQTFTLS